MFFKNEITLELQPNVYSSYVKILLNYLEYVKVHKSLTRWKTISKSSTLIGLIRLGFSPTLQKMVKMKHFKNRFIKFHKKVCFRYCYYRFNPARVVYYVRTFLCNLRENDILIIFTRQKSDTLPYTIYANTVKLNSITTCFLLDYKNRK